MATKFKVGDRVRVIQNNLYPNMAGMEGVICGYSRGYDTWDVEFLGFGAGHSCDGAIPSGQGWRLQDGLLEFFTQPNLSAILPADAAERKKVPIGTGVMDYFPAALAEVAKISYAGNQQHNPGEPLHWARGKSTDQADTMLRHFLERGTLDSDGQRHSAKMCWRALAILQLELEAEGAPVARGAKS